MDSMAERCFKEETAQDASPPHPGEVLREDILPNLTLTASELARHLAVPPWELQDVLHEVRPMTVDLAVRLGVALPHGARYWLALQLQHDLWIASRSCDVGVKPLEWRKRSCPMDRGASMRT